MNTKKNYDLIVSLGGNCSAASNLRYRNLRFFSLPFDWVYMVDERPITYLCEGFKDKFKNLALYENLKQEEATPEHKIIYRDLYSGYLFPNHFIRKISIQDYQLFYEKLQRRVTRLLQKIDQSNKILFILAAEFDINDKLIFNLYDVLKYVANMSIDMEIMIFGHSCETEYSHQGVHIKKYLRKMNPYDFYQTNFEWAFLDDICLESSTSIPAVKEDRRKPKIFSGWTKLFGTKIMATITVEHYKNK